MPEFVNNSQVRPEIAAGIAPSPAPVQNVGAFDVLGPGGGASADAAALYHEIVQAVLAGLPGVPKESAQQIAVAHGKRAAANYDALVKVMPAGEAAANVRREAAVWLADAQRENGVKPSGPNQGGADIGGAGGTSASLVPDDAIKDAWSQYVNGIDNGKMLRELLGLTPTDPLPTSINTALTARDVRAIDPAGTITGREVESITGPQLGSAAVQEDTRVADYDTTGLRAVAAGQGPLADQVRAQNELASMKASQTASGIANQARAEERAAVRRAAALKGADLAFEGRLRATETLADKATQATQKLAELDAQKKDLQAQLDAARRDNDANRAQRITEKLADLELETKKVNAEIAKGNADRDVDVQDRNIGNTIDVNTANANIDAGNADRTLTAGEKTADLSLRAQDQEEKQRIERGRFRIEATKAIEDSAKGLLTEANRQATLAMARRELALAEQRLSLEANAEKRRQYEADRSFWAGVIGNLLTAVVPKPPGAAKGGLIDEPTLVAEGQHDELVIPVSGVSPALRKALSVESQPFSQPVPVGALLKAAMGAQQPEPEPVMDWGRVMMVLAPANNRARKVY